MTAIRNFPDAPLARRAGAPSRARVPAWATGLWRALSRAGQLRAAFELDRQADRVALSNPVLARELRAAAADCRRPPQNVAQHQEGSR
jgi:hypothetical protein